MNLYEEIDGKFKIYYGEDGFIISNDGSDNNIVLDHLPKNFPEFVCELKCTSGDGLSEIVKVPLGRYAVVDNKLVMKFFDDEVTALNIFHYLFSIKPYFEKINNILNTEVDSINKKYIEAAINNSVYTLSEKEADIVSDFLWFEDQKDSIIEEISQVNTEDTSKENYTYIISIIKKSFVIVEKYEV